MTDVVTIIYEKENPEDAVSLGVILILMVQFKFILDFWSSKTRLLFCLRLCQENARTASRIAVVIKAEIFFICIYVSFVFVTHKIYFPFRLVLAIMLSIVFQCQRLWLHNWHLIQFCDIWQTEQCTFLLNLCTTNRILSYPNLIFKQEQRGT